MADITQEQLNQAREALAHNNKRRALGILMPLVSADPENAEALWLYAQATDDSEERIRLLEKITQLQPDNQVARAALHHYQDQFDQPAEKPKRVITASSSPVIVTKSRNTGCSNLGCIIIVVLILMGLCTLTPLIAFGVAAVPLVEWFVDEMDGNLENFDEVIASIVTVPTPDWNQINTTNAQVITLDNPQRNQTITYDQPDAWRFTARAEQTIQITVNSDSSFFNAPAIFVYNSDRQPIGQSDGFSSTNGEAVIQLRVTFPRSGDYFIVINGGAEYQYDITVSDG